MGRWEDHIQERTLITSGILTENGQVAFNICALIFSSLLKMLFRCLVLETFFIRNLPVLCCHLGFSWTSTLCMIVLLIVYQ